MFQCGDKVVYANYGVCEVSKVDEPLTFGGEERSYYVLSPLKERGGTVYVPMDKETLIRGIMNRAQAITLIHELDEIELDDFKDSNSRTVEDHFKKMLRGSDCRTAVRIAKTMHFRIQEQEQKKHLPSSMYTRIFDQADRQARSELCAALEVADEELDGFIASHKG